MTELEKVIKGLEICAGGTNNCTPCPFKDNCKGTSNAAMAAAIKLLKAQEAQGWISVKDRPPKEKGWYEVYAPSYTGGSSSGLDNHSGVMFAKWSGKTWSIEVGYHKRPGCVTHWMPITEPPKEGENG